METRRAFLGMIAELGLAGAGFTMSQADAKMWEAWLDKPALYSIETKGHRAVIKSGTERTILDVRHLDNALRRRGLGLKHRTALITDFFNNRYHEIAENNLQEAVKSPYWNTIAAAASDLDPQQRAFVQGISIQESLAGRFPQDTGKEMHDPAVGIFQVREGVLKDARKIYASLEDATIDDLRFTGNIDQQVKVIDGYVHFLERAINAKLDALVTYGQLSDDVRCTIGSLTVASAPEEIALAYNVGLDFLINAYREGPVSDISEKMCSVKNFREILEEKPPGHWMRQVYGPQKAMIGRAYGKAIAHFVQRLGDLAD